MITDIMCPDCGGKGLHYSVDGFHTDEMCVRCEGLGTVEVEREADENPIGEEKLTREELNYGN